MEIVPLNLSQKIHPLVKKVLPKGIIRYKAHNGVTGHTQMRNIKYYKDFKGHVQQKFDIESVKTKGYNSDVVYQAFRSYSNGPTYVHTNKPNGFESFVAKNLDGDSLIVEKRVIRNSKGEYYAVDIDKNGNKTEYSSKPVGEFVTQETARFFEDRLESGRNSTY